MADVFTIQSGEGADAVIERAYDMTVREAFSVSQLLSDIEDQQRIHDDAENRIAKLQQKLNDAVDGASLSTDLKVQVITPDLKLGGPVKDIVAEK